MSYCVYASLQQASKCSMIHDPCSMHARKATPYSARKRHIFGVFSYLVTLIAVRKTLLSFVLTICTRPDTKIVTETRMWCAYEYTAYEDHCRSLNIVLNLITTMPLTVNDIKTVQFLLIVRAGLAVMEGSEKGIESLHADSLLEFTTAVKNYRLNSIMSEIDKSIFMRTKNFLNATCKPTDMHTGESIWRKFKDIRRYIANDINPAYNQRLPGGQLPSGKSMEEILKLVRKDLWDQNEQGAASKNREHKVRKFDTTWYPVEWTAFLTYSLPSDNPADFFRVRESNGPTKSDSSSVPKKKNRKEQRKIQRTKDQIERHIAAKIPSKEEKRDKKERKQSGKHTAALNYSFALEARKENIKEQAARIVAKELESAFEIVCLLSYRQGPSSCR
jgi:hypothetical protein